jgi:hypothetical protein
VWHSSVIGWGGGGGYQSELGFGIAK